MRWFIPRQIYTWGSLVIIALAAVFWAGWYLTQEHADEVQRNVRALVCLSLAHQQVVVESIDVTHIARFPSLIPICGASAQEIIRMAEQAGVEHLTLPTR